MASATLLQALCLAGARKSDGTAVASGKAWLYLPGTTTDATIYADESKQSQLSNPIALDSSGRPNASSYPDGVFVDAPTRVLVQTSAGVTVSDTVFSPASAGAVAIANAGFTGTSPTTGAQVAGGETTLDDVLDSAFASVGGTDFQYKESSGATARTIKAKFSEIWISILDYDADPTGIADSTTAIQAAMNRVAALGGGVVDIPPGTYKVSSALTLTSKNGVSIIGAGRSSSILKNTGGTTGVLSFTTCSNFVLSGFRITHSSTSTGTAIVLGLNCANVVLDAIGVDDQSAGSSGTHRFGLDVSTGCNNIQIRQCIIVDVGGGDTAARAVRMGIGGSGTGPISMFGPYFYSNNGVGMEVTRTTYMTIWGGQIIGGTKDVKFVDSSSGNIAISGTRLAGFDMTAVGSSASPLKLQQGTDVAGYTVNVTSGGTVTPDFSQIAIPGGSVRIVGTTTGVAYTVNLPSPAGPGRRDFWFRMEFVCAAGAPITGWGVNAGYHFSTGPSTTDTQHTMYIMTWDADNGVYREASRSVTT